ncbi:SusC/RagA family TonB-linked outer membrane protein [Tunicatimonas pelagia]|uniref:SusC/RagA family TonB-linked outer membrane protein n=1 Tax=Tunicatimonas pelagia TaxID=931531 RepID=UPI002665F0ED|nr:TonB-dependent receptor [Tunicatimonas pelagia]WKN44125.1 TonB-dependent receptor [Tunicatimonas pelagia]
MKHFHRCVSLIFLLALVASGLSAQQLASVAKMSGSYLPLQKKKKALSGIILSLGNQYQVRFNFNSQLVKNKFVAAELMDELAHQSLDAVLDELLPPLSLTYKKISEDHYVIVADQQKERKALPVLKGELQSNQQDERFQQLSYLSKLENQSLRTTEQALAQTISGRVIDNESGEGLPGVNVLVKETTTGTVSDIDGNYKLTIDDDATTLVFSSIGYTTQEVDIQGRSVINLELIPDVQSLSEVVVIGYGEQKKESVVGSIVQTTGEVLQQSGGVSTVGQALTGRVPGVITVSTTGRPGEEDPEIFIRGRSTWNGSGQPLVLVDGIERSMNDVNINDIEKISVLKDASATAVFGVKGANGVILITTKRGQKGKPQLSLSVNSAFKTPSKIPQKLSAFDGLAVANDAIEREVSSTEESWADYTPRAIMERHRNPANQFERERYPDVDWADVVLKDFAMDHNVNLSVRGGSDFAQYFGALSYQRVGDIFDGAAYDNGRTYQPNFGYDRFNYRSNVDFDITKTTRVSVNLSGFYGIQRSVGNDDMRLVYSSLYGMAPTLFYPIHEDGTYGKDPADIWDTTNPLMVMTTKGARQNHRIQVNSDIMLEQDLDFLLEGLTFNGRLAYDNNFRGGGGVSESNPGGTDNVVFKRYLDNGEELFITPPGENQFDFVTQPWFYRPISMDDRELERRLFYQFSLNYEQTFGGKHNTSVLLLMNREEYAKGSMFPRYREDWVARATYNYDERYFLDVNGAYNGSERFGPGYRFELFPSAAVGWAISNEPFMQGAGWLDMLKIRGSYGVVGDDDIKGRWGYISQWASGGQAFMNNANPWGQRSPYTFYREDVIGNPNLRWETSTKANLGFDLTLMNNLVTATVDVFQEERDDIIVQGNDRSVPAFLGFSAPDLNVGRTSVEGIEIALGFNHYVNPNLKLWSNINFTQARSRIEFREEPVLLDAHLKTEGFPIGLNKRSINGELITSWDDVYMSVPLVDDMQHRRPGYYDQVDFNSDGRHDGNTDRAPYGYPEQPINTWNWTVGTDYHGLSVMVQFYGAFNVTKRHTVWDFHKDTPLYFAHNLDYWTVDNPTGTEVLPEWKGGADTDSYRDYLDASFVRLKNVEIAYNFPGRNGNSYKVFVGGNNLFLWSNLPDDRESNRQNGETHVRGDYPTFRRINVGFNINF